MTFVHKEAFRLMQYQDEDDPSAEIEWLWNSRDGVTPFMIGPRGNGDDEGAAGFMKHINWQDDILALQYVPNVGQRVFIDLTREAAELYCTRKVARQWAMTDKDAEQYGWNPRKRWSSQTEMLGALLPDALIEADRGAPDVVVCTPEMQRRFVREREERRSGRYPEPRRPRERIT